MSAVPGPAASTMAVTISGFPSHRFVYEGFLPRKGRDRTDRLGEVADETRTIVLYEAPHRMQRTMADLLAVCGPDRGVAVSRELTKLHEETVRGTLGTIDIGEPRGEYVIVLAPVENAPVDASDDTVRRAARRSARRRHLDPRRGGDRGGTDGTTTPRGVSTRRRPRSVNPRSPWFSTRTSHANAGVLQHSTPSERVAMADSRHE